MRNLLFFCLFIFMISTIQLQAQCLTIPTTLNQRLSESELVVEGKVIGQHSFWDSEYRLIYTAHTVQVYKQFKGSNREQFIEIITPGGIVGNEALEVTPSLKLQNKNTGVFILRRHRAQQLLGRGAQTLWQPIAAQASFLAYSFDMENVGGVYENYNSREALYEDLHKKIGSAYKEVKGFPVQAQGRMMPSITSLSTTNSSAGDGQLLTIIGTGFGATADTVYFDSPDDGAGGSYLPTPVGDIVSWNDNSITVEIPGGAGTGVVGVETGGAFGWSASTLTINYNVSNTSTGDTVMLIDDAHDGNGGYTFYFGTETANSGVDFTTESSGAALAAFQRAVATWQAGTSFSIYTGSSCVSTDQVPGADDINIVAFDSDAWDLDVVASSSTLGVCYNYFSRCGSSEWEAVDKDLIFRRDGNPNGIGGSVSWEFGPATPSGGEIDFESVALHELGHAHGLGHVINSGAVMHYSVSAGTSNRTLGATDDIAGGTEISDNSVFYNPPVFNCGPGNDYNSSRDYLANGGGACLLLPVELQSFRAHQQESSVLLEWGTASETNCREFILEHSRDGRNFEKLVAVRSKGSVDFEANYQHTDINPKYGINYYRLWQVEWDGKSEYLGMVSVEFKSDTHYQLFPNPMQQAILQLMANTDRPGNALIEIVDINGRKLYQFQERFDEGGNALQMNLPELARGVYYCRILHNDRMEHLRFVKE